MNVDLIKAIDAEPKGAQRSERAGGESEFPGVFESTLRSGEAREQSGGAFESGSENGSESGSESRSTGGSEEAAAESAEAGAAATAGSSRPAEEPTEREAAESEWDANGRLTEFDEADGGEEADLTEIEVGQDVDLGAAVEELGLGDGGAKGPASVTETASGVAETASARVDDLPQESSKNRDGLAQGILVAAEGRTSGEGDEGSREGAQRGPDPAEAARGAESNLSAEAVSRQAAASAEASQRAPEVVSVEAVSPVAGQLAAATTTATPVAGQLTAVTTTATPGSPSPVVASEAISVQTEWLATRGGGTARLVLHPPELGELAIRVTLRGGVVDVVMVAQEAAARGVAEEQAERLAQAFSNRDMRLDQFEVRRGSSVDLGMGDEGRSAQPESERDDQAPEDSGGARGRLASGTAGSSEQTETLMPRIATAAPEAGVDLRI